MSENWPKRRRKNKGFVDKLVEWYRVYETRLSINLLEPWEKVLSNILVLVVITSLIYLLFWSVKFICTLILT